MRWCSMMRPTSSWWSECRRDREKASFGVTSVLSARRSRGCRGASTRTARRPSSEPTRPEGARQRVAEPSAPGWADGYIYARPAARRFCVPWGTDLNPTGAGSVFPDPRPIDVVAVMLPPPITIGLVAPPIFVVVIAPVVGTIVRARVVILVSVIPTPVIPVIVVAIPSQSWQRRPHKCASGGHQREYGLTHAEIP